MSAEVRRHPIETFLRYDQATCGLGVAALLAVHVFLAPHPLLVVEAVAVAVGGAALGAARRPLGRDDPARAVSVIAVVSWLTLLAPAAVTPFVEPVLVVAALLPVVLAIPYVSPRHLAVLVVGSTSVAGAVAVITAGAGGGVMDQLPGWLPTVVVAAFLPAATGMIGLLSGHNHQAMAASRARLVASTDQARRGIERDLHDGAQQRLVSVAMQLGLARSLVEEDPDGAVELLADLEAQAHLALAELRDLCLGVYPAALTDFGLAAALTAAARPHGRRCRLEMCDVGRLPEATESAVYFSCLEALQNAVKHAGPDAVITIRCERTRPDRLRFSVRDDGAGFDPTRARAGAGLANIADRVSAMGGNARITSAPGHGTCVAGEVPLPQRGRPHGAGAVIAGEAQT
ncbi:MAG: hypothetical protein GEV08_02005 [Acidimicrobiia bacterium]|nr:hypothetical protein [Acidimicrobiia bacterium]